MEDIYDKWVMQLREGSYEAFSELYMYYSNKLYSFILAQTKNVSLSEDIVQETFMKLWNMREQLDCYGNVNALIFTIARNLLLIVLGSRWHSLILRTIVKHVIKYLHLQHQKNSLITMSRLIEFGR